MKIGHEPLPQLIVHCLTGHALMTAIAIIVHTAYLEVRHPAEAVCFIQDMVPFQTKTNLYEHPRPCDGPMNASSAHGEDVEHIICAVCSLIFQRKELVVPMYVQVDK
jgi:hypothetical protein